MSYRNETIKDKEFLAREYIKEAGEAGKRVRFVLGIIVTASILAFAGFWNSLNSSWKTQRLITLERLNTYLNLNLIEKKKVQDNKKDEKSISRIARATSNNQETAVYNGNYSLTIPGNNKKEDENQKIKEIIENVSENSMLLLKWERKGQIKNVVSGLIPKYVDDENKQEELKNGLNEKIDEWSQDLKKTTCENDWNYLKNGIKKTIENIENKSDVFETDIKKNEFSEKVCTKVKKLIEDAYDETLEKLKYAIDYYKPLSLGKAGIENLLQKYNEFDVENVKTIKVPFFGISLDVNDLGFIGGFTLLVLMLILYFSLKREHENLSFVSGFIKDITDKEIKFSLYRLLAMNQLLSMTSLPLPLNQGAEPNKGSSEKIQTPNAEKHTTHKILRSIKKWIAPKEDKYCGKIFSHIPKVLILLPLILFVFIVRNDFLTLKTGKQISSFNTRLSLIGAIIFMVLLGIYTYFCLKETSKVDRVWNGIRICMKGEDKPKKTRWDLLKPRRHCRLRIKIRYQKRLAGFMDYHD